MNVYHLVCHQPVYYNGEFSHTLDRLLKIYAPNAKAAQEYYEASHQKEEKVTYESSNWHISVGRESVYMTKMMGKLQTDITLKFLDIDGKVIASTNSVVEPWQVVSWLTHQLDTEQAMFPFSVEAKEVFIEST